MSLCFTSFLPVLLFVFHLTFLTNFSLNFCLSFSIFVFLSHILSFFLNFCLSFSLSPVSLYFPFILSHSAFLFPFAAFSRWYIYSMKMNIYLECIKVKRVSHKQACDIIVISSLSPWQKTKWEIRRGVIEEAYEVYSKRQRGEYKIKIRKNWIWLKADVKIRTKCFELFMIQ